MEGGGIDFSSSMQAGSAEAGEALDAPQTGENAGPGQSCIANIAWLIDICRAKG